LNHLDNSHGLHATATWLWHISEWPVWYLDEYDGQCDFSWVTVDFFVSVCKQFCSRPHFQTSSWTIPNPLLAFSGSGSD